MYHWHSSITQLMTEALLSMVAPTFPPIKCNITLYIQGEPMWSRFINFLSHQVNKEGFSYSTFSLQQFSSTIIDLSIRESLIPWETHFLRITQARTQAKHKSQLRRLVQVCRPWKARFDDEVFSWFYHSS